MSVTIGDFLLRKLAVQENTFKELSGEANSSNERANHGEGKASLEKMKHETVEAEVILIVKTINTGSSWLPISRRLKTLRASFSRVNKYKNRVLALQGLLSMRTCGG